MWRRLTLLHQLADVRVAHNKIAPQPHWDVLVLIVMLAGGRRAVWPFQWHIPSCQSVRSLMAAGERVTSTFHDICDVIMQKTFLSISSPGRTALLRETHRPATAASLQTGTQFCMLCRQSSWSTSHQTAQIFSTGTLKHSVLDMSTRRPRNLVHWAGVNEDFSLFICQPSSFSTQRVVTMLHVMSLKDNPMMKRSSM